MGVRNTTTGYKLLLPTEYEASVRAVRFNVIKTSRDDQDGRHVIKQTFKAINASHDDLFKVTNWFKFEVVVNRSPGNSNYNLSLIHI